MKSAWKIKARWCPAFPTAGERRFFQNEIYLHPLTWDIQGHFQEIWSPSVSNLTQKSWQDEPNKIVWPAFWRLEMPSGRVSFAGKVNSRYFQSSLKVRLFSLSYQQCLWNWADLIIHLRLEILQFILKAQVQKSEVNSFLIVLITGRKTCKKVFGEK